MLTGLPHRVAGTYRFTITESNLSDAADKFETRLTIEIIHRCVFCEVTAPANLTTAEGLEMETFGENYEVNLSWDPFTLVPVEISGITVT